MELLVAILVLAMLAMLLFPLLGKARSFSGNARCLTNLRNIHIATLAFVADHNGLLPPSLKSTNNTLTHIHPNFNVTAYWWETAYIGRYLLNDFKRSRYDIGDLNKEEVKAFYICPSSMADTTVTDLRPDYTTMDRGTSLAKHRYATIADKFRKLYVTEGRSGQFSKGTAITGAPGRLRRYHEGGMNILFLDGHIEAFHGSDEELHQFLW